MRTTVDISEDLFRRAKAEAALRGIKFKDLVEEALVRVLEPLDSGAPSATLTKRPTLHELMQDYCGIVDSGVDDLATHPKHLQGFGRDSMGHR